MIAELLQQLIPLTIVLFIPGYLIATNFALPGPYVEEHHATWWFVLSPLIFSHLFVVIGHLLMAGHTSVNFIQFIVSLSLPVEAVIGIPMTLFRASFIDGKFLSLFASSELISVAKPAGLILMIIGFIIFCYTNFQFLVDGNGTLSPLNPPKTFVSSGLYKYARNPMISSVLMMIFGEILYFNLFKLCYFALSFFVCKTAYFIFEEEPALQQRFGESYAIYCEHVPRWGMRSTPYNSSKEGKSK